MENKDTKHKKNEQLPARERLLSAASELFYREGIHTVGIDRILKQAGVAKATLYTSFGNKEGLIEAYLTRRKENWERNASNWLLKYDTSKERILGVFDMLYQSFSHPGFHGCAFMNALAEEQSGSVVEKPTKAYRAAVRKKFQDLVQQLDINNSDVLVDHLVILYDGATINARMDHNADAALSAKEMAAVLIDKLLDKSEKNL
ncbi:TetR/AcrR family transcriptional regulator [Sporolactobacillus pectinivorans]|uniref:TetR/AcrR family transcriptional regulator n=1 Tax=Sporolactobacillus pectinivorans TaxID=1591408 RepID=UPI000C25DC9D|nr:TetR/AcrR family transcriptional regulator [Sporolactobacillus pectinivorans]